MIALFDYGLGNLANVKNALEYLGYEAEITNERSRLEAASHIILPGVGHFADAMGTLEKNNFIPLLKELRDQKPFIGICLGMQLLFEYSEEGEVKGLGWLPGTVRQIISDLPVPHLGWNTLSSSNEILNGKEVYFIHSYHVVTDENVVARTEYGQPITAVVQKDNLIGIQFHPEKSGKDGLAILDQALKGGFLK